LQELKTFYSCPYKSDYSFAASHLLVGTGQKRPQCVVLQSQPHTVDPTCNPALVSKDGVLCAQSIYSNS
jgi:hypothetical protein